MATQLEINLMKIQTELDIANKQITNMYARRNYERPQYTPLSYIEGTGAQAIDTGVVAGPDITYQIKMYATAVTGGSIIGVGSEMDGERKSFRFFNYNNTFYLDYGSGEGYNRIHGGTWNLNTTYDLEVGNRYVKNLTNNSIIISADAVDNFSFNAATVRIFGDGTSAGRIYYMKIYKGAQVVCFLIPARRDTDGAIGMFDLIQQKFHANLSSTPFIAGGVV